MTTCVRLLLSPTVSLETTDSLADCTQNSASTCTSAASSSARPGALSRAHGRTAAAARACSCTGAWRFADRPPRTSTDGPWMVSCSLSLRHGWGCQVNAPLGFRFLQLAADSVVADLDRVVFGGRTLSEAEANTKAAKVRVSRALPAWLCSRSHSAASPQSELVLALHEIGASYRFGWGVEKSKPMVRSCLVPAQFPPLILVPHSPHSSTLAPPPRRPSRTSSSPPTSATSMRSRTSRSRSQTARAARRT